MISHALRRASKSGPAVDPEWNLDYVQSVNNGAFLDVTVPVREANGIAFKSDGMKMYVVSQTGSDAVYQYSLSTAWDLSTATYDSVSFVVTTQDGLPMNIYIKPDGTKFYIVGNTNDSVFQYSMSTAWDLSTASYDSKSFSVSTQTVTPTSIEFKADGTKMYVGSNNNADIYEYDLSTAWDVSTASINQTGTMPRSATSGMWFKSDGTKLYSVSTVGFIIDEQSLSSAWDVSTLSSVASFDFDAEINAQAARGLFVGDSGSKIFFCARASYFIFRVDMSTAYDLTTAAARPPTLSFKYDSQVQRSLGSVWKPDGTKVYIIDNIDDEIHQYDLSTAWDVSTTSYASKFIDVTAQDPTPNGVAFKSDGSKMYIVGDNSDSVFQYSLSTAWDISTATYDSVSFSVTSQESRPRNVLFRDDGTKMYISGQANKRVYQYSLSTAWDISTASYDSVNGDTSSQVSNMGGLFFKPDGTKLFAVDEGGLQGLTHAVYEYTLGTAWDASTISYTGRSCASEFFQRPWGISFKDDGTKMFLAGERFSHLVEYAITV